jgi:hypothetical protein
MTQTHETLLRGTAGLGDTDCLAAIGTRVPTTPRCRKQAADRARRRYLVAKLHALGPAPLLYFLREIEEGADLRRSLETYAALPADLIRTYGGDQFTPALFDIDGRRS